MATDEVAVILVGGEIAAGKTTLAHHLGTTTGTRVIRVRDAMQEILGGTGWDRRRLQAEGLGLDRRTNGRWLLDYLTELAELEQRIVVDAARTRRQVEPILESLDSSSLVYLTASESVRRARFTQAQAVDPVKYSMPFDEAMAHVTEREVRDLVAMAHLVVDTDDLTASEVTLTVAAWAGFPVA
jgi:predicted kinase